MKLVVIKRRGELTLSPAYKSDVEAFSKLKENTQYQCTIKKPRNLKFHKKFFALLKLVVDNTETWQSVEHLLVAVKEFCGYVDVVQTLDGSLMRAVKSINFESMDNIAFEKQIYTPAIHEFARILDCSVETLEQESKNYM